jgi:hypothetical protein
MVRQLSPINHHTRPERYLMAVQREPNDTGCLVCRRGCQSGAVRRERQPEDGPDVEGRAVGQAVSLLRVMEIALENWGKKGRMMEAASARWL